MSPRARGQLRAFWVETQNITEQRELELRLALSLALNFLCLSFLICRMGRGSIVRLSKINFLTRLVQNCCCSPQAKQNAEHLQGYS